MFHLLTAIVFGALWWAILWFGIAPDFSKWSRLGLLALHVLPPVAACLSWWTGRTFVKRYKARQAEESQKKAEAERQAALEEARTRHAQELQQRRFGCDCRLVAISDLAVYEKFVLPENPGVTIETVPAAEKADAVRRTAPLDALQPAIMEALRAIYTECGAAAVFPLYILPPAEVSGTEAVECLRAIHAQLINELSLPITQNTDLPSILYLPSGDSAANSVLGVFDNAPDLPGAVVLAFDSPLSQCPEIDPFDDEQAQLTPSTDKAGHGVFALLVTHPELPGMLATVVDRNGGEDLGSLTPYWEKSASLKGNLAQLGLVPQSMRDALIHLPPVARIHRSAFGQTKEKGGRVLELERALTALLEHAQIHAGLKDMPFVHDDAAKQPVDENAQQQAAPSCAWLVHNAGDVQCAGSRLAAIGNALMRYQIELNPIEMGTNLVRQVGDLGRATSIGMLAIALAKAQETAAPALCAEFSAPDSVAVWFAVPAKIT